MYLLFQSLFLIWFILITLSDSEGMDTHVLTRISKQYVRHTVTYNYEHSKKSKPSQAQYYYYYYYYYHNLWIRSPTRYPLRHMTGSIWFLTTSIRHTPFVVG